MQTIVYITTKSGRYLPLFCVTGMGIAIFKHLGVSYIPAQLFL